ncbi:MAG: type II toxin-antitoxin system YafQ family toxin [Lachnospiraceae bacterium]|nr:type II toxin-antitoxin system YafQ family toxin [Lachnospiraceae bacterium]
MRKIEPTVKFKKDYKKLKRQPFYDDAFEKEFTEVISNLAKDIPLEDKYRDHQLLGQKGNIRECHVAPDWLLVYSKDKEGLKLILLRTGTHSNILRK